MTRCTASDGRRCCNPEHTEGKHLRAPAPLTVDAGLKIAAAWGWTGRLAHVAVNSALAAGTLTPDRLIATMIGASAVAHAHPGVA